MSKTFRLEHDNKPEESTGVGLYDTEQAKRVSGVYAMALSPIQDKEVNAWIDSAAVGDTFHIVGDGWQKTDLWLERLE